MTPNSVLTFVEITDFFFRTTWTMIFFRHIINVECVTFVFTSVVSAYILKKWYNLCVTLYIDIIQCSLSDSTL